MQTVIRQAGGLRSGLMFYADGNTRDGMVDMISGSPGLIVGDGGSMVVRPESRGWAYAQAYGDSGLFFDTPVLRHLQKPDAVSMWLWGDFVVYENMPMVQAAGILLSLAEGDAQFAHGIESAWATGFTNGIAQALVTWKKNENAKFYKDGVFISEDWGGTTELGDMGETVVMCNNLMNRSSIAGGGTYFGAAIWNRQLDAEEVGLLARDPLALRRLCWRKKLKIGN